MLSEENTTANIPFAILRYVVECDGAIRRPLSCRRRNDKATFHAVGAVPVFSAPKQTLNAGTQCLLPAQGDRNYKQKEAYESL
jgi:hypothetical protein